MTVKDDTMINPRTAAFNVLLKIEEEGAYSNIALNNAIKEYELKGIDASFMSAIVYSVLERQLTLDYILSRYSKLPLKKIETKTLIILRMGVTQILFMDKVPESAAVNESVKLAKKKGLQKSSGFINGILRSIVRAEIKYTLPDKEKDYAKHLSVKYSCPTFLIDLWLESYGEENTLGILQSLADRPVLTVRVNTLKADKQSIINSLEKQNVKVREVPFIENALYIENTGSIENLDSYKKGEIYVQDASSQLCVNVLSPKPNDRVLDICSAPGGKAFSSAMLMHNKGEILAFDMFEHKLRLINSSSKRLGINIIKTAIRDGENDKTALPLGDCVLCDVPCSGLGIIRRKPEIRYKLDTSLDKLADIQYRILCNSSQYTATGGVLVYSTCTLNPKENGNNADRFLQEHKDSFEPIEIKLPKGIQRGIDEPSNQLTVFPHKGNTDGFFISVFRKVK